MGGFLCENNNSKDTSRAWYHTRNYDGYRLILAAVQLAVEDEDRLRLVTKEIYRPVSILCCCPLANVERNIHTVIFVHGK
ncbi:MAG: hypothetical protein DBY39_03635 [Clostridiales bacterium]|nr:MAG: hypothetical protein DBY39_03635 [Clostridiales bacterium]